MFFFFFPEIAEALKSDGSFMNLLRREAHFKKGKDKISFFFHPDLDTLHEYVLGSLGDEKIREVMDHLSGCEECLSKVQEIRRLDKEVTEDLRQWMKNLPLDAKGPISDKTK